MKRPTKKRSKKIMKNHPAGGKGLTSAPIQAGSIVCPSTAGPGGAASVSATGGGTVTGA